MTTIRVLLAGESWISESFHIKGWDFFASADYQTGTSHLKTALTRAGFEFTHLPNHLAAAEFPLTREGLAAYDVVILSDIGSSTLLLHPDTWLHGRSMPNRLRLVADWVADGGGLIMCGGYYSFQGIYGAARYRGTPIEDVLPVDLLPYDDRIEIPEGARPEVLEPEHPIMIGISPVWPELLGCNEVTLKPDACLLAKLGNHPLLAVREHGLGRTLVWTSDIGPHWCPEEFADGDGYARLWQQAVEWLAEPALVSR